MDYSRLFISLPIEEAIIIDIFKKFKTLNLAWEKLKVVKTAQMHLTLKFLGDTAIDKIPLLIETLQNIKVNLKDLELLINGTVIFNDKTPKVLALKIKNNKNLNNLFQTINQTLFEAGQAHKEARQFSPHLTLARVKQSATHKEFDDFINWRIRKTSAATYFELKESVLTKKGPEYTTLQTFDL